MVYCLPMSVPPASVSVICVYNDPAIRQQCLDRSIQLLNDESTDVEYLPIDNVNGAYPTAGAALNYGASLAKNNVLVFVHQDVFLHSLTALKEAAGRMSAEGFGLLGATGISSEGRIIGRIRDRVVLSGDTVAQSSDVESVDEVLFMAPRSQVLREPLTESGDMGWHAYAVEYGLRMRGQGRRTGVVDIPLTHNSLTINVDRLDIAHRAIAARYADLLPVHTTCGVVTRKTGKTSDGWLSPYRWRYPWLRESLAMQRAPRNDGYQARVLADIRRDVDSIIARCPGQRLHIINRSQGPRFCEYGTRPLELTRRDGKVVLQACDILDIPTAMASILPSACLLTNLSRADLKMLEPWLPEAPGILGLHTGIGYWLLLGATPEDLPLQWQSNRAVPLGARALVTAQS